MTNLDHDCWVYSLQMEAHHESCRLAAMCLQTFTKHRTSAESLSAKCVHFPATLWSSIRCTQASQHHPLRRCKDTMCVLNYKHNRLLFVTTIVDNLCAPGGNLLCFWCYFYLSRTNRCQSTTDVNTGTNLTTRKHNYLFKTTYGRLLCVYIKNYE